MLLTLCVAQKVDAAPTIVDLGTLGGTYSIAIDVNDFGHVVGTSTRSANNSDYHAFLWKDGQMTDLGSLDGGSNKGGGINNSGQVVGYEYSSRTGAARAFLYQNGVMVDLGTGEGSAAYDINNNGEIVGGVGFNAFLYRNGVISNLRSPSGEYTSAFAINDNGQIAGEINPDGKGSSSRNVSVSFPQLLIFVAVFVGVVSWVQKRGVVGGNDSDARRLRHAA